MLGSGEDGPSQPDKSFVPETQWPWQDLLSVSCGGYFVPLLQPRALTAGTSVKAVWSQACLGLPRSAGVPGQFPCNPVRRACPAGAQAPGPSQSTASVEELPALGTGAFPVNSNRNFLLL